MGDIKRRCNPTVDLSKFKSNKKILNKVVERKKKAWKKSSNFNQRERVREREEEEEEEEEEELRELSRIVCYSKHNDKMYIRTPFIEFYN